jgi:hypothetical protein
MSRQTSNNLNVACGAEGATYINNVPRRPTTNPSQIAAIVSWGLKRSHSLLTTEAAVPRRRR